MEDLLKILGEKRTLRTFKLWVFRDPDDWEHEFASVKKPRLQNRGKTYCSEDGDLLDLRGRPLGLQKGELVRVECSVSFGPIRLKNRKSSSQK